MPNLGLISKSVSEMPILKLGTQESPMIPMNKYSMTGEKVEFQVVCAV